MKVNMMEMLKPEKNKYFKISLKLSEFSMCSKNNTNTIYSKLCFKSVLIINNLTIFKSPDTSVFTFLISFLSFPAIFY